MAGEWQELTIEDIADVVGGSTPSTSDPSNFDGDIPWLTPRDLSGPHGRYVGRGERSLSAKGLARCSAQLLPENSVMLTTRAPVGYVAIAANLISTNQGFRNLILKPGYDHEFLYYWLTGNVPELERHASGSTFKELSGGALKKISIRLPSELAEQRAIAHILGALDDKVELNRRMNETLEGIARAIFKSWFVDFDPVRAKMEGREPYGMDAETAAAFPEKLSTSRLGEIPEGWEAVSLGDEFDYIMGQSPPGSTYNEEGNGMPLYQGKGEFGFRFPTRRLFCTAPQRVGKSSDTLVSVRAPVGAMNMAKEECCIGRGLAAVRHRSGSRSYTYYAMQELAEAFSAYDAEGTVFGSINKSAVGSIPCLSIPEVLVRRLDEVLSPLDSKIELLEDELSSLSELRDTLLPKLLSGEIRIKGSRGRGQR